MERATGKPESENLLVTKSQSHSYITVTWERRQSLKNHQSPRWEMWEGDPQSFPVSVEGRGLALRVSGSLGLCLALCLVPMWCSVL